MAESKKVKLTEEVKPKAKSEKKAEPKAAEKQLTHVKLVRDDGKEFRVHVSEVDNHMATGRFTKG